MTIFHLNPVNGRTGICHDSTRACPISRENHFTSLEAVSHAVEVGDFSKAQDENTADAFATLRNNLGSPLVNYQVAERFHDDGEFEARENRLLILLGNALILENTHEDDGQLRAEKEKLLGEISDVYFVRNSLSNEERSILDNLEEIKNLWLRKWN